MADNGLVSALTSGIFGSARYPDDGVTVLACFRPGDAVAAFERLIKERLVRAGYSNIFVSNRANNGDVSNVALLAVGWRKPIHPGHEEKRRLDAARSLALSQALGRMAQEYFFSPEIQDAESTGGRGVVLVAHPRRQQAVAAFVQEELPSKLPGFKLARVFTEGVGESAFTKEWAIFGLQLAAGV